MKNMNMVKDISGQKFGRLTALSVDDSKNSRQTYWICQCDCGKITIARNDALKSGAKKSCGCLKNEQDKINLFHGKSYYKDKPHALRLYSIWQDIKGRCYNEHNARYSRYGGRGITVCENWANDFLSFYNWSIENGYSDELTIDRIDNDGNYEPCNCRWATMKQQCNNRCTNINIKIGNSTKTLTEWCEIFNLDYKKINARYNRNGFISIDDLFNR